MNNCFSSHVTTVFSLKASKFKHKPFGRKPSLSTFWLVPAFFFCALQKWSRYPSICQSCTTDMFVDFLRPWHPLRSMVVCEGCSALLGQTDPCFLRVAGTQQSALTDLRMEPKGLILVREFLEHRAFF